MDFKVRCVKDSGAGNFITGKIYTVKGGIFRTENGHVAGLSGSPFQSVDEINMRLASEFELVEEEKVFAKDDLRVGYVVEHCNGMLAIISENQHGLFALTDRCMFTPLSELNGDLTNDHNSGNFGINKVYGFSESYFDSLEISTKLRPLLWERKEEPLEITIDEIAKWKGVPSDRIRIKE